MKGGKIFNKVLTFYQRVLVCAFLRVSFLGFLLIQLPWQLLQFVLIGILAIFHKCCAVLYKQGKKFHHSHSEYRSVVLT